MQETKPIVFFDEGDGKDKKLLGGKGAGLCEMTRLGFPVPLGFVITTEICNKYYEHGTQLPHGLVELVRDSMKRLEEITGRVLVTRITRCWSLCVRVLRYRCQE